MQIIHGFMVDLTLSGIKHMVDVMKGHLFMYVHTIDDIIIQYEK